MNILINSDSTFMTVKLHKRNNEIVMCSADAIDEQ